jgi:predicted membrane protein
MDFSNERRSGKVVFGLVVILIGLAIFLKQIDMLPYLNLRFTWPLILIVVGLFIGIRNKFNNNAPFILIAIGVFNLIPAFSFNIGSKEVDSEDLVVPVILIIAGLVMIFRHGKKKPWTGYTDMMNTASNMTLNADILFGGRKEIVTSKEFKGGRVAATFGGAEINLTQADSTEKEIILDLRATFGGIELLVPSDWDIQNEIQPILGSVEDQRTIRYIPSLSAKKTLILQGSCFCGGIEIKSY